MPHSKVKRSRISKHLQSITKHLKKLKALHKQNLPRARIIRHHKVTLGELRAKYTPHHKSIPAELLANVHNFQRIQSDPTRPLFIYGRDGGLIAHRTSLHDAVIVNTLTESLKALPR